MMSGEQRNQNFDKKWGSFEGTRQSYGVEGENKNYKGNGRGTKKGNY